MKKYLYIAISLIIVFITQSNVSLADDDCKILTTDENWAYVLLKNWWYQSILPDESIKKVFDNLKSYCCGSKIYTNCSGFVVDQNVPDSPYLFDHMLDVYLRRLDAKQWDDNGGDLIYWLQPDPKWHEWRKYISDIANNIDGYVPGDIASKYKETWKSEIYVSKFWNGGNNESWASQIEKAMDNYNNWALWDRYDWACDVVMYLSLLYTNHEQQEQKTWYDACRNLVTNRINAEKSYTEAVMQWKWTLLLERSMSTYLDTYFFENKLAWLQDIVFQIKTIFTEINKWIKQLIHECN